MTRRSRAAQSAKGALLWIVTSLALAYLLRVAAFGVLVR